MPSSNRKKLVDPTRVGTYYCVSRCVRRARFCGRDLNGLDVSHRRQWVRRRLKDLVTVFAVEVLDYGVLDNAIHSLLRIRPDVASQWSDEEVVRRWHRLNRQKLQLNNESLSAEELQERLQNVDLVKEWRRRLSSLTWFMVMLKEPISRAANLEDKVSGHFFGERFACRECRTMEDIAQTSLFNATSPVQAGLARRPEDAEFTSYRDRLDDERWGLGEATASVVGAEEGESVGVRTESETGRSETEGAETVKPETVKPSTRMPEVTGNKLAERPAAWLAPLALEGDGRDEAAAGRRLTNEGFLPFGLEKYKLLVAASCRGELLEALASGQVADGCASDLEASSSAEGEMPRVLIPSELPVELEGCGLDPASWADSFRRNAWRFERVTRKTDELRRDFERAARGE